jgi:hypothetical protein
MSTIDNPASTQRAKTSRLTGALPELDVKCRSLTLSDAAPCCEVAHRERDVTSSREPDGGQPACCLGAPAQGGQVEEPATLAEELERLRRMRDGSKSLREMGEWCVAIEEAMGGRPPTRGFEDGPR